jgi:hypothetical protein
MKIGTLFLFFTAGPIFSYAYQTDSSTLVFRNMTVIIMARRMKRMCVSLKIGRKEALVYKRNTLIFPRKSLKMQTTVFCNFARQMPLLELRSNMTSVACQQMNPSEHAG